MTITIECDGDQPRNPDNQPPPYRDDALVKLVAYDKALCWEWRCPCDGADGCHEVHFSERRAQRCLERHLYVTHGE